MISKMKKITKQLLCRHNRKDLVFKYNFSDVYIDSKYSSLWVCSKCGKRLYSKHYVRKDCDKTYALKLLKFYRW